MSEARNMETMLLALRPGSVLEWITRNVYKDRAEAWRVAQRLGIKIKTRAMLNGRGLEITLKGGTK